MGTGNRLRVETVAEVPEQRLSRLAGVWQQSRVPPDLTLRAHVGAPCCGHSPGPRSLALSNTPGSLPPFSKSLAATGSAVGKETLTEHHGKAFLGFGPGCHKLNPNYKAFVRKMLT